MADEKSDKGFSVVDRRIVTEEEGAPVKAPEQKPVEPVKSAGPAPAAEPAKTAPETTEERPLSPPMTFVAFLLSLHTSALIHLGLVPDPSGQPPVVDLEMARQNIDLLEVIQDKTKGNLSPEEARLLENVLYELRMVYLQVCEKQGKGSCGCEGPK